MTDRLLKTLRCGAGIAIVCGALLPLRGSAQSAVATEIAPTVTFSMGDLGGRFRGQAPDPAKTRHYYVAAEPELWDYAPLGQDVVCGKPLPPPVVANRKCAKLRYVQYTDATFQTKIFAPPRLGILGPVLRGVVGEFLAVTFLNRTEQPLSMHPHGVQYDKDSEGAYYEPKPGRGSAVAPGATFTYVWQLDAAAGPQPGEPSSKAWLYHSHVNGDEEINAGLVGFIVVTDPARARPDGTPADVDREMAALFLIFDESGLGAAVKEAAEYVGLPGGAPPAKSWSQIQQETEQGSRYAINGRIFGNLAGLEMNEGERVRWYLFGLGSESDVHSAHWHGLRAIEDGRRRTDVVELLPASMKIADIVADNPGSWMFHCHVAEHMQEGMFARCTVHPRESAGASRAPEQAFFITPTVGASCQITTAEAVLDPRPDASEPCTLRLTATVSIFEAFSVFRQPIGFQLGDLTATWQPNQKGTATNELGSVQVLNTGAHGVIYGGAMELAFNLHGAPWRNELRKLGVKGTRTDSLDVPVTLLVGQARHSVKPRVTFRSAELQRP